MKYAPVIAVLSVLIAVLGLSAGAVCIEGGRGESAENSR